MEGTWFALSFTLLVLLLSLQAKAQKDCSPNPCKNKGRCYNWPPGNVGCNCPRGYVGKYCAQPKGLLRVLVKTGANLQDRDGPLHGRSDPYVEVVATDHVGIKKTLRTRTDHNDQSPEWNQWLDFGVDTWDKLTLQVFDRDFHNGDDRLSKVQKGVLKVLGSTTYRLQGFRGYVDVFIVYSKPPIVGIDGLLHGQSGPSSG